GPGRGGRRGRLAAQQRHRPRHDGARARALPRRRLLQDGAVVEPHARARARVLRQPRLRAPRLQLPGGALTHMPTASLLSVSRVSKSFGTRKAIDEISFQLWPGEVLAVVGESGSGKTTLLNCVSGRLRPDEGTVEFGTRHEGVKDIYAMSEAER